MHLATCKEFTPIIVFFPSIARTPPSANRTLPDLYGVCSFFEAMPSRPRCLHLYEEQLGVLEGFRVADIPMIVSAQERLELCFRAITGSDRRSSQFSSRRSKHQTQRSSWL